MDDDNLPIRVLHLIGGLRALDDRSGDVTIQINSGRQLLQRKAVPYADLYRELARVGLPTIGVEFINLDSWRGIAAPDWHAASPSAGFRLRLECNQWGNVRTKARRQDRKLHASFAERATTYLELLAIRVLHLSQCYNHALTQFDADDDATQKIGHMFRNSHGRYIDAAIHAFVADAASFRDLIAEMTWTLLVQGDGEVRKIERFIRLCTSGRHPISDELLAISTKGDWMFRLSSLRNEITHVAPLGGRDLRDCAVRAHKIGGATLPRLHYPLFGKNDQLFDNELDPDFRTDESALATIKRYKVWSEESTDALDYMWRTCDQLVDLLARVRVASGLEGEMITITDDDIIGPVNFKKR